MQTQRWIISFIFDYSGLYYRLRKFIIIFTRARNSLAPFDGILPCALWRASVLPGRMGMCLILLSTYDDDTHCALRNTADSTFYWNLWRSRRTRPNWTDYNVFLRNPGWHKGDIILQRQLQRNTHVWPRVFTIGTSAMRYFDPPLSVDQKCRWFTKPRSITTRVIPLALV